MTFEFPFSLNRSLDEAVQEAESRIPPPIPVLAELEGDFSESSVEEQVQAIRDGGMIIDAVIELGGEQLPDELASIPLAPLTGEEAFFVAVHELTKSALITQVIASRDRRWFCDGVANVVAMRECDLQFGDGAGERIFISLFPPEKCEPLADQVDLLNWMTVENETESLTRAKGLGAARYYFATRLIEATLENQDESLLGIWIRKIRETPWNRTHAGTVIEACHEVVGIDLNTLLEKR